MSSPFIARIQNLLHRTTPPPPTEAEHQSPAWRIEELDVIEQIARQMTDRPQLQVVLDTLVAAAARATGADRCDLYRVHPATGKLKLAASTVGPEGRSGASGGTRTEGIVVRALLSGAPVLEADITRSEYFNPLHPDTRAEMIVPVVREATRLGVIILESQRPDVFSEDHLGFVSRMADLAAVAIRNALFYETVERRAEALNILRSIAVEMLGTTDLRRTFRLIASETQKHTGAVNVHVYLYDAQTDSLRFGSSAWQDGRVDVEAAPPRSNGITAHTARSGERIVIRDLTRSPFNRNIHWEDGIGAFVCVPLKHANTVVGVFSAAFTVEQTISDEVLVFLDMLAVQAAAALSTAHLTDEIREGRDRLQTLVDNITDGIIMVNRQNRIMMVNPRADSILSTRVSAHVGQDFFRMLRQSGRGRNEPGGLFDRAELHRLAREIRANPAAPTRRRYTLPGKEPTVVEEVSSAIIHSPGVIAGRLIVLRDVTQENNLELYRQDMSDMLVHDLRSPLSGLISWLYIAQEQAHTLAPENAILNSALDVSMQSARSMLALTSCILDISKLESGEMPLALEPVNLHEAARSAATLMASVAQSAEITVSIQAPPHLEPVYADQQTVERVMINLLDNALKYTPVGGSIRVTITPNSHEQRVTVEDSGPGVDEAHWQEVFDRFVQVNTERRQRGGKGTG
ncbi:MAG: GAF domain-containing protein, partial [Anaerolineae bacterium]|nr:GAF domain-containing protein [Anaerolineae bacterium]